MITFHVGYLIVFGLCCLVVGAVFGYMVAKAENYDVQRHFDLLRTQLASRADSRTCADCHSVFLTKCKLPIFICKTCRDKDPCTLGASDERGSHE